MALLSRGNEKLGKGIVSFNLPAKKTCPGATKTCLSVCYATNGRFRCNSVKNKNQRNLEFAKRPDFDRLMVSELTTSRVKFVRIHSSGDLYDAVYANAWYRIIRALPDVTFWLYTRSWRKDDIRGVLKKMARLPNLHLWYSVDKDTGIPGRLPRGVRTAWLMTREVDVPAKRVDLVFLSRKLRKPLVPSADIECSDSRLSPICPTETGLPGAHEVTCASCRKCFTKPDTNNGADINRNRIPLAVVA